MTQPAYIRIAREIRDRIHTGELSPGDRLPSLDDLAKTEGVSRQVVRNALALLRVEGLVHTDPDAPRTGTVVAERSRLVRVSPDRYEPGRRATYIDESEQAHLTIETDHHGEITVADVRAADHLGIDPGDPVHYGYYRFVLDGTPVALSHCYEPLDLTDGVPIGRPHDPPMDRFADVGHTPTFLEETLRFRAPTAEEVELLAVPVGLLMLEITQMLRSDVRALEVSYITYVTTRYDSFVFRMTIPPRG